jgi:hypothetical protein
MPSLHALYDALVSINVPTSKALAVVESMERDMLAQLATKSDVEHAQLLMRADFEGLRKELKAEIDGLRKEVDIKIDALRRELKSDIEGLRNEFRIERNLLRQDMEVMRRGIVIWLGSLQIVGMSLLFAGLKLT